MAQSFDPREIRLSAARCFSRLEHAPQAERRLVEVSVVVRAGDRHSVSGLKKSDFEVRDNGKRHETTVFSAQSVAPAAPAALHGRGFRRREYATRRPVPCQTPPCAAAAAVVTGRADSFWAPVRMQSRNTILTLRGFVSASTQGWI